MARLNELERRGVQLAIDDFGTGYSSLAYLQRFPIDVLKLDRSFIGALDQQPATEAIVRSLVDLGRALELSTVAEGIEREEQIGRLLRQGCQDGQGFYFARPMPADRVADYLLGRSAPVEAVA